MNAILDVCVMRMILDDDNMRHGPQTPVHTTRSHSP